MSLYDRLVPAEALRFDRSHPMTVESYDWHIDMLRYAFAEVHQMIFAPLFPIFTQIVNVVADAASAFPDIFPVTEDDR